MLNKDFSFDVQPVQVLDKTGNRVAWRVILWNDEKAIIYWRLLQTDLPAAAEPAEVGTPGSVTVIEVATGNYEAKTIVVAPEGSTLAAASLAIVQGMCAQYGWTIKPSA